MERFSFDGLPDAELTVTVTAAATSTEVAVSAKGLRRSLHLGNDAHTQLHWACVGAGGAWVAPTAQPPNSRGVDEIASRISLDGSNQASLSFPADTVPAAIAFVVLVEANGQQHWLKRAGGADFLVDVPGLAAQSQRAKPALAGAAPRCSPGAGAEGAPQRVADRPAEWPELAASKTEAATVPGSKRTRGKVAKKPPTSEGGAGIEGNSGTIAWHVVHGPAGGAAVFVEVSLPLPEDAAIFMHWGCQEAAGGAWAEPLSPVAKAEPFGDGRASRTCFEGQARAVLSFPEKKVPNAIAFVLFASVPGGGEQWLKDSSGADFGVEVAGYAEAAAGGNDVSRKFCDAETKYEHWSQFQRVCLANEVLSKPHPLTALEAAWLACDLRLAHAKALEWYRNRGYQPKDMAHAQEALGGNLSTAACKAPTAGVRTLLRLCATAVPRGSSGGGDAIRHGILNIMRTHGIKEGHRPGIECKFIEQWHQKLHTNSAPDDIVICEGYLAFLSSGNPDDLWRTIWERGHITREDLSKMCTSGFKDHTKSGAKGLNVTPLHLPQLYNDMNGYLGLLKHVHGGTDLHTLCEACKGQYPDHGAECMAFEIYNAREDPFIMGKIVDLRRCLQSCLWKRDVLMLDVAMEDQLRRLAERADASQLSRDDLIGHLGVVLSDLQLSRGDPSIDQGVELFRRLAGAERWGVEWCKLMHAACDRLSLVCTSNTDEVAGLLQGCADGLLAAGRRPNAVFQPDEKALAAFGEETARCLTERLVAQTLKHFMPALRRGAGLGPWELVSPGRGGEAVGTVEVMASLPVALEAGRAPVVAVLATMTGWEDIPAGVAAVLLPASQAVDVLSHVAIRARNQQVLLASSDDDALLAELHAAAGRRLRLQVGPSGGVTWTEALDSDAGTADAAAPKPITIKVVAPPPPPAKVLGASKFTAHSKCMGGKSLHLAELQPKNGEYRVPQSITVPFRVFEEVLADAANEGLGEELDNLIAEGEWAEVRRMIVDELAVPEALGCELAKELAAAGAPALPAADWQHALKSVWASKWTDRAVSSRRQTGLADEALFLAVLCQPLFPSAYAFVIHTRSPLPGAGQDEQLVELCVGLGESLVSNSPGRALSASVGPAGKPPVVHTYPSKPEGVFAPEGGSHIFRSDSNGEDLEGFAGAGLYDSVTVVECTRRPVSYAAEPLLFDAAAREALLRKLYDLGRLVEARFGGKPQDIEGAVGADGSLVVTQSRPQV